MSNVASKAKIIFRRARRRLIRAHEMFPRQMERASPQTFPCQPLIKTYIYVLKEAGPLDVRYSSSTVMLRGMLVSAIRIESFCDRSDREREEVELLIVINLG